MKTDFTKYKLIALDCDGTLLNSQKEITARTKAAINSAMDRGVNVVLASARPFYRLHNFIETLGLETEQYYSISFNGGLIVNNTGTEVLVSQELTEAEVRELIDLGNSYSTEIFLYSKDAVYADRINDEYQRNNPDSCFKVVDLSKIDLSGISIYKIIFTNTPERTNEVRNSLPARIVERYEVSNSVPHRVEFVSKGITKSKALEIIGAKIGISPAEMIAFGDQDNDIPMLKSAGFSVAMGNATDEVKDIADYVTTSNDEDGVAIAIEELLIG